MALHGIVWHCKALYESEVRQWGGWRHDQMDGDPKRGEFYSALFGQPGPE